MGVSTIHAASETEIASKIRAEAEDFLTALLGQGRAKVIVSVDGEQTQSNTASERMTPVSTKENQPSELPGYAPDVLVQQQKLDYYNKNEQNLVISGYTIKRIMVSVVLDSSVGEKQVAAIQKLMGNLLHLNFSRGDELNIVRAQLLSPWKAALQDATGIRMLALFGGAAILAIFMGFFAYWAGMRMIRAFAGEVTGRIMATITAGGAKGSSPIPAQLTGLGGGDLLPGEMPDLLGEESEGGRPGLGHRFDFLSARKPEELARILATETPEDIALLSAYLVNTNPDLAGAIFAALPSATQTGVSHALAALQMADPERLAMLESRMKTAVEYSLQGSEKLGRILSHLPQEQRETVIGDLSAAQPERAAEVEKALFPFEDIIKLSSPDLRRLIMAVHYEEWGIALRGAHEEVVSAVLNQLLAGSRSVVREAMEMPQTRQKVAEARSKIVAQAHAMAARGQIMLRAEEAA